MENCVDHIEVEGRQVLGFDTGLTPAAFAQAKLAQLISAEGVLVRPNGTPTPWRPEGVTEREGTMIIWGPAFPGVGLDTRLNERGALDALRTWLAARSALGGGERPAPYPAAAIIGDDGSVLFPPAALVLRGLDSRGQETRRRGAERWVHPDRSGVSADAFAGAAMAYRIFADAQPFGNARIGDHHGVKEPSAEAATDALRSDIREGFYLPARLAAPGLRPEVAELLDRILSPNTPKGRPQLGDVSKNDLGDLLRLLGDRGSGGPELFLSPIPEERIEVLRKERERFMRKRGTDLARRRFVRRNTTAIVLVSALLVGAILTGRSIAVGRASRPTTAGLSPLGVAEAYYEAFGQLDHEMMEASTVDNAGEGDVEAVLNLFVISRVREAYEQRRTVISAEEWIAKGSPETDANVFGVTDLELETLGGLESEGELVVRARYRFWFPQERSREEGLTAGVDGQQASLPIGHNRRTDILRIVLRRGLWRIAELRREVE